MPQKTAKNTREAGQPSTWNRARPSRLGLPRGGRSAKLKVVKADDLQEPLKMRVGGSLSRLPALQRLAMLQRNALLLRGGVWQPPPDHGTLVRKTVGAAR